MTAQAQPKQQLERSGRMASTSQGQFHKIKARQREQDKAWLEEQRRRDADPFEQALRFLRRRGYIVAPNGSPDVWVCGNRHGLSAPDLVALATRLGCSFERTIYEREAADRTIRYAAGR